MSGDKATRIELIQTVTSGWRLYVGNQKVGSATSDLSPAAAKHWADTVLGGAVTWVNGRPDPTQSWFWVASPGPQTARTDSSEQNTP